MNDEILIELVREQRVLYDLKDRHYMNTDLKGRIWQEIGFKMKVDGSQCKARWNNIRDNFRKSLGKRRTKSGQAVKKTKPYRFESQLQFLQEFMEERETKGNIGTRPDSDDGELNDGNEREENLQTSNILSSPEDPASPVFGQQNPGNSNDSPSTSAAAFVKPTRVSGGRKNTQPDTAASTLMKYLLEKKEEGQNSGRTAPPTVSLDNPIDCFLFGISSTLKSFPPYLQHLAKSEIFSTVQKLELQTLQSKQMDCPGVQAVQRTSYPIAATFHQLQPVDDTSSSQDAETMREYWTNFDGQQQ
ncbi:hypothetical protein GE061_008563 [Apolygus lucorum]|uniref:Uncharacterized protein n=1 Tax=Apolygus lucorum TaxID=248454 RepID=A0A6A4K981_APOLU|nr:hypothetical protein GE061_008563 [Apolygus lucorum]